MPPNILLIILDSVRAKNLSIYGHYNDTTPNLREFGQVSTTYTQARSPSVSSRPSHASIFTGYHPIQIGTSGVRKLRPGHTVWEYLSANGYETAVFSDNPFLRTNRYGFIHGFEQRMTEPADFVDLPFSRGLDPRGTDGPHTPVEGVAQALAHENPIRSLVNGLTIEISSKSNRLARGLNQYYDRSAETYLDSLLGWIDRSNAPWAACVNLLDAHYPYEPPVDFNRWGDEKLLEFQESWEATGFSRDQFSSGRQPWWQLASLESLYDGSIRYLDFALSGFIDELRERGQFDDTCIVITSDHGESFGEVSYFDKSTRLATHWPAGGIHETRTHVPLIVKYPDQESSRAVHAPASLVEFSGVAKNVADGGWDESDFIPEDDVIVSVDAGYDREHFGRYTVTHDHICLESLCGNREASVKTVDAQSSCKIADSISERTFDVLDSFEKAGITETQSSRDLNDATENRLQDLGYIE